jgi:hypothetical protein
VVDASFEHRIDEAERETLREAMLNGEVVSPPAGAIGRGDAFVLRIAERTGAVVLSNDSFQEFHGQHPWLFDEGRSSAASRCRGWGGSSRPPAHPRAPRAAPPRPRRGSKKDPESAPAKAAELAKAAKKAAKRSTKKVAPVVDTTWPIIPSAAARRRARGPATRGSGRSRLVERHQRGGRRGARPAPTVKVAKGFEEEGRDRPRRTPHPRSRRRRRPERPRRQSRGPAKKARGQEGAGQEGAPAKKAGGQEGGAGDEVGAGQEVDGQEGAARGAGGVRTPPKRRSATPPPAVNAPLSFITFVATYPVGTTVEGEVVSFTSHGAMVDVALPDGGSLHCYIPLSAMGDPPPTKARQVLTKGDGAAVRALQLWTRPGAWRNSRFPSPRRRSGGARPRRPPRPLR